MRALPCCLVLLPLLLGGCIPRETIGFSYAPPPAVAPAAGPPLSVVVQDQRRRAPNSVGEVRGLMGSTAGRAETAQPVAELVRQGFEAGLAARGLALAPPGQAGLALSVALEQFDAVQVVQRGATARLTARLADSTGRVLWQREVRQRDTDRTLSGGAGTAPVAHLAPILARLLRHTVDQVLDDPGFRAALSR